MNWGNVIKYSLGLLLCIAFVLCIIAGDLILQLMGIRSAVNSGREIWSQHVGGTAICTWLITQLMVRRELVFIRWQTYLGILVAVLGSFSTLCVFGLAGRIISDLQANALMNIARLMIIACVVVCKLSILVYCWKVFGYPLYRSLAMSVTDNTA